MSSLLDGIHLANLLALPHASKGPRANPWRVHSSRVFYETIRDAGYRVVQAAPLLTPAMKLVEACGLRAVASGSYGSLPAEGKLERHVGRWADDGYIAATLLVGRDMDDDDEAARRVETVLELSERYGLPIFIETHRATITQDIRRTLELVERFPELRFNGDFSHYYFGHRLGETDLTATLDLMEPILLRTRFLHGRIAGHSEIQAPIESEHTECFGRIWTAAFRCFLAAAAPDEDIVFAPELLPPFQGYGATVADDGGNHSEPADRWQEALGLTRFARRCFDAARRLQGVA